MQENELKRLLLTENKDFQEVYELHRKHEEELENIRRKPYLTESDKLREKELKKIKLKLKDKMYHMMAKHKKSFSK